MSQPNRIYFLGNPYPKGHTLEEFLWSGRIEEDESMWFDFHLKTDPYYAEEAGKDKYNEEVDDDDESKSNWESKGMWGNYVQCTMSSTRWGDQGIQINKTTSKAVFNDFIKEPLLAHTFPLDHFNCNEVAFGIYLLGHDSCANHKIKIKETAKNKFEIEWSGKIAETYYGSFEFNHDFSLHLQDIEFDGFHYPKTWSLEKASHFFKNNFEDFEEYDFVDLNSKSNEREYKFKKK